MLLHQLVLQCPNTLLKKQISFQVKNEKQTASRLSFNSTYTPLPQTHAS